MVGATAEGHYDPTGARMDNVVLEEVSPAET
jgi:hypothetical protein